MGSLTAFFLIITVIGASFFLCAQSNVSRPSVVHLTATYYEHYNFLFCLIRYTFCATHPSLILSRGRAPSKQVSHMVHEW